MAKMFLAGANALESKKEIINDLNVFPVPDGDTGTNMTMTIMSAAKEVGSLQDVEMTPLCKAISSGSLRGARGNSGVILSQLLRGFTKTISSQGAEELDVQLIAAACTRATETAYKAVMKPKEGTILTVARAISESVNEFAKTGSDDLKAMFDEALKAGQVALDNTPELLPVLKQAGVVDSGGTGLIEVLTGAIDCFNGKKVDTSAPGIDGKKADGPMSKGMVSTAAIKYTYNTEFIILLNKNFNIQNENDYKEFLESIGDSIDLISDEKVVKVHVNTNDPGLVMQRAFKYGQLDKIKIDNMKIEHKEAVSKQESKKKAEVEAPKSEPVMDHKAVGFISVAAGDGIVEIMKSIGVDEVIAGFQTMNPSTEDFLNAIEKVNADTIFVYPNNKNIIMAANQAAAMTKNKRIVVVPSTTIPQGIAALLNYVEDQDTAANEELMKEAIANIVSGQVTYSIRDTMINDKEIKQGDFMGMADHGILTVSKDLIEATVDMAKEMVNEDSSLISLYYGADIKEEDAEKTAGKIREALPDVEVEVQFGGQPVYYYIVSAE